MAIGGETTGWGIELDAPLDIEGQKVSLLEIEAKQMQLDEFENSQVEAWGRLKMRQGVERKILAGARGNEPERASFRPHTSKGPPAGRTGILMHHNRAPSRA